MDLSLQVLKLEYEAHQARYRLMADETAALQRYVIVLSAATWSWAITNGDQITGPILIWLPTLLTILFGMKAAYLHSVALSVYLRLAEIEKKFGLQQSEGWYQQVVQTKGISHGRFDNWLLFFWVMFLLINLLGGYFARSNLQFGG